VLNHSQLHELLMKRVPNADPVAKQDRKNSISSKVIRCRYHGQRAVAVGSDSGAKAQISALLDLLDLHLHVPANVDADHVTLILGGCPAGSEALDAIGTLVHSMTSGPKVRVLVADDEDSLAPVGTAPCDFSTDAEYPGWIGLLMAVESGPPAVLRSLVGEVVELAGPHGPATQALRAYQMLSSPGRWSLRLEGLEVGQFKGASGWLGVGKVGKLGALSAQRQAWIAATGADARITVTERAAELSGAAAALWKFAQQRLPRLKPDGNVPIKQDEHALESRVLRGFAPSSCPASHNSSACVKTQRSTGAASSRPSGAGRGHPATWTRSCGAGQHRGRSRSRSKGAPVSGATTGTPSPRPCCTDTSSGRRSRCNRGSKSTGCTRRTAEPPYWCQSWTAHSALGAAG